MKPSRQGHEWPGEPAPLRARFPIMTDTPSVLSSAVAETAAAGPTRFTLRLENAGSRARLDHARPRGPVRRLARVIGRRLTRTVVVDGVLDLGGRRVLAGDDQAWGMVQIGHRVWSGRAGRRVEDRLESPAPLKLDPLGLLDSVAGLRTPGYGDDPGPERHLVARTDRGTIEVWLDGGRVHRIRRDDEGDVSTMTLHETDVDADALDWTRLPAPAT